MPCRPGAKRGAGLFPRLKFETVGDRSFRRGAGGTPYSKWKAFVYKPAVAMFAVFRAVNGASGAGIGGSRRHSDWFITHHIPPVTVDKSVLQSVRRGVAHQVNSRLIALPHFHKFECGLVFQFSRWTTVVRKHASSDGT